MTDSLKDQLLKLGFNSAPREERPARNDTHKGPRGNDRRPQGQDTRRRDGASPDARRRDGHPSSDARRPGGNESHRRDGTGQPHRSARPPAKPRAHGDIDLAKAYAIRSQREKDERIAAEKLKQEEAARRREGKAKLIELLKTASLNVADADIARHFEYGGKIRRVYVTAEQLKVLNVGELAVVQQGGRYHLVTPAHAHEAEALLPGALALLVDPNAPSPEVDYADPKYQVPDDLVW